MIPFFTNVLSHNENWEPVYKALFEITFDFPPILGRSATDVRLALENANAVNLPLTPDIEVVAQRFKYSTRAFVTLPKETHIQDLSIKFNLNEDDKGRVYIFNMLKAWYDLVWNSQDGTTHTKREIVGTIIVNQHNKKGKVIRRVTYKNVQIIGLAPIELAWENPAEILVDYEAKFVSDFFEDLYIDQ